MGGFDLFTYFLLGILALIAVGGPIGAIRDLRRGSARTTNIDTYEAARDVEPGSFWLAVWGQVLICPVAIIAFWVVLRGLQRA